MSTALLQELHQEYRRLYIAGSELAAGDFRLKRLLQQFQQFGERSPVFKRLGEGIAVLLEPGSPDGPAPAFYCRSRLCCWNPCCTPKGQQLWKEPQAPCL